MGRVSRRPPGASRPEGSQVCTKRSNAPSISGEYMSGSSSDRARPSPCSPDSEPSYFTARCAASVQNALSKAMALGKLSGDNLNTTLGREIDLSGASSSTVSAWLDADTEADYVLRDRLHRAEREMTDVHHYDLQAVGDEAYGA